MEIKALKIGETYIINTYEFGEITGKLIKLGNGLIILDDGEETHKIIY